MNEETQLKKIYLLIKEGFAEGVSPEEIFLSIDEVRPPRIIVEAPPLKTSPERLQYQKDYYAMRKELEAIKEDRTKQKEYIDKKIEQALKRTGFYCYNCKSSIECDSNNNKHTIERKRNDKRQKIIITNSCPNCGRNCKGFGGYLSVVN